MNKRGDRFNVDVQDNVVSALYNFARQNESLDKDITCGDGLKISTKAVRSALEEIMSAFGYKVASIQ